MACGRDVPARQAAERRAEALPVFHPCLTRYIGTTPVKIGHMRIGTWNLAGGWSPRHRELLTREKCDVWLLTEVHPETSVSGMQMHRTSAPMGERKTWAAILSSADLIPVESDPHWATVAVHIGGLKVISSVLPWRSRGPEWGGSTLVEDLRKTLAAIRPQVDETTMGRRLEPGLGRRRARRDSRRAQPDPATP